MSVPLLLSLSLPFHVNVVLCGEKLSSELIPKSLLVKEKLAPGPQAPPARVPSPPNVKEQNARELNKEQSTKESNKEQNTKPTLSIASVRFRQPGSSGLSRLASSRRHDLRYHSNPVIPVMTDIPNQENLFIDEMRKTLAVPVSERRKFFERVAEYNSPF